MSSSDSKGIFDCNRRDFLKAAGLGAAALTIPGMAFANPGAKSMSQVRQNEIEADILVIGGGMAGIFAAVKAKEKGLDVILVAKGAVAKSGLTPWANTFAVFNEKWGHSRKVWEDQFHVSGRGINNKVWTNALIDESYARYEDLISWGVKFGRKLYQPGTFTLSMEIAEFAPTLRKKIKESGINTMERVMITDLLTYDGRVVGAIGFPLDEEEVIIIRAKATIMCAGAGAFKPSGFPCSSVTSDGDAMAYRVGAEITGKEFVDTHVTSSINPAACHPPPPFGGGPPAFSSPASPGTKVRGMGLEASLAAHVGQAPIYRGPPPGGLPGEGAPRFGPPPGGRSGEGPPGGGAIVGGASAGLSVHKAEGIFPQNEKCASNIPGLYAAGDGLGSMQNGACYAGFGCSLAGSAVQGTRAAEGAAEYASKARKPVVDKAEIERLKKITFEPRERKKGFTPGWVTQILQNTMIPYFVLYVKKKERLKAALTSVEFLRDHFVPKLTAKDTHELRLAHETKNMILNAEMKLRASLFRTESRGNHYREDYPKQNDSDWLAWVKIKDENGKMKLIKEPIPKG